MDTKIGNQPRSMRSTNPKDAGYKPRNSLYEIIQNYDQKSFLSDLEKPTLSDFAETETADIFRQYFTDVLDQYTTAYYDDEDPALIGTLIERLAILSVPIFSINLPDLKPDPTTIETMFDDLIEDRDGEAFSTKYGILDFYNMLKNDIEEAEYTKPTDYQELARYLEPTNEDLGRQRVDYAIIDSKRTQARWRNKRVFLGWICMAAAAFSLIAVSPKILVIGQDVSNGPMLWRYAEAISWPLFSAAVIMYFVLMFCSIY